MVNTYSFDTQLAVGTEGEEILDDFFHRMFHVKRVTTTLQRKGIDRIFQRIDTGKLLKIEYKTDHLAHKTGNAFLETVSIDRAGKRGWGYTSEADYLIYFVFEDRLIYVLSMKDIRIRIPVWKRKYPTRCAKNEGYQTFGILVPLDEFERCAEAIYSI